ncbi:unnamed protein product [Effrenium voratum]|uniref:Trafficking protein particle complex subunit 2 n=1 Tax=Effrenium voratum TaxID=2562239 RepID=A0AA36J949_9DINO|nr:unnamed protein product [Effrenium voratum]
MVQLMEFIEGAGRLRGNAKALDIWRVETKLEVGLEGGAKVFVRRKLEVLFERVLRALPAMEASEAAAEAASGAPSVQEVFDHSVQGPRMWNQGRLLERRCPGISGVWMARFRHIKATVNYREGSGTTTPHPEYKATVNYREGSGTITPHPEMDNQTFTKAVVNVLIIVGKDDIPIYEADLSTEGIREDSPHLDQFVIHSALDMVDDMAWTTSSMFLRNVDKFNDFHVSAYCTAGRVRMMLLHKHRNEEAIRAFFADLHELFIKAMMSPFQTPGARIHSPVFDQKVRAAGQRHFRA